VRVNAERVHPELSTMSRRIMRFASLRISKVLGGFLLALFVISGGTPAPCSSETIPSPVRLHGHVPTKDLAGAKWLGGLASDTRIPMAFALPLRNRAELQELLGRIYDPADPLYGHYLTSREFTDRFGPTQADYDAVISYARSLGLTVTGTHPNRTLLDVSGPAGMIEAAFALHLRRYQAPGGREFYAPDDNPEVPDAVASRIAGVVGLDNAAVWHAHRRLVSAAEMARTEPFQIGTGPGGGLTPGDIRTAYNLQGVAADGTGQVLGLFELDGYRSSDVTSYESYYGLPSVPLQNVLIDGFSGRPGSGADEVTLDIELQIALAPGASKIIIYEGPNSNTGVVDTYNRIATDNLAKQISTSWGLSEGQNSSTVISSENTAFLQMAAQGQSIYAAAGDSGAYDDGTTLSVDDPASQPYMVGVGGTQLFVNADGTYNHETTWNVDNTVSGGAGGGGISSLWSIPSWQQGIATAASATMRNVPDVSLNADQNTGYSIYYHGGWWIYGGTSCTAPLWAALTARVNQQRAANGYQPLGFANPAIYQIAKGARYGADFHDITQGTNLFYGAGTGYDNATGWGSFNGANLLADLAPPVTYTLTYTAGANGTISGISPQTVNKGGSGSQVTAVPNTGYHFVSWSDGVATASRTDTNVTANISVTASFAINTYTLTYTPGAHGTISGVSPQTVNWGGSGTKVTAVPNTGYHFVSWSDGVATASRTDTNVTANISVTASFAINTYTLTYTPGANGTISGVSPQTVNWGGSGTQVTAVPSPGYQFVSWSDGVRTAARTDASVTANISVTATFNSLPYVQIVGYPQVYYGLLQLAYNAAATGAVIQAQGIIFTEDLSLGNSTDVTLEGGWDPTFSTQNGYTVLQGLLTVSEGQLVVDHLIIK